MPENKVSNSSDIFWGTFWFLRGKSYWKHVSNWYE